MRNMFYNLDMGLGKTLQALCIIAGNSHTAAHRNDTEGLPSIVVCPTTLVGHWHHEVKKFLTQEFLQPVSYTGPPYERDRHCIFYKTCLLN